MRDLVSRGSWSYTLRSSAYAALLAARRSWRAKFMVDSMMGLGGRDLVWGPLMRRLKPDLQPESQAKFLSNQPPTMADRAFSVAKTCSYMSLSRLRVCTLKVLDFGKTCLAVAPLRKDFCRAQPFSSLRRRDDDAIIAGGRWCQRQHVHSSWRGDGSAAGRCLRDPWGRREHGQDRAHHQAERGRAGQQHDPDEAAHLGYTGNGQ